jgi:hypothetical protein
LDINITMKSSQTTRLAIALGAVLVAAYLLSNYSSSKGLLGEGMESLKDSLGGMAPLADGGPQGSSSHSQGGNALPSESLQSRKSASQSMYTENHLSGDDLLPKGGLGASWAAVNPAGMGDLKGQNFLEAGYHTNTAVAGVSQTNRNSSWDVRSETPNPQGKVGPFMNTTIESNPFKRGLDA